MLGFSALECLSNVLICCAPYCAHVDIRARSSIHRFPTNSCPVRSIVPLLSNKSHRTDACPCSDNTWAVERLPDLLRFRWWESFCCMEEEWNHSIRPCRRMFRLAFAGVQRRLSFARFNGSPLLSNPVLYVDYDRFSNNFNIANQQIYYVSTCILTNNQKGSYNVSS